MTNAIGGRMQCTVCGSQGLVVAGGNGTLSCCGLPMVPAQPPRGPAVGGSSTA